MATAQHNHAQQSGGNALITQHLERLNAFIGHWHAEGTSYGTGQDATNPLASAVPWVSDESYEWLPGNFFVLHTWHAMTGDQAFVGTEIIGYDADKEKYFTHFFDNSGFHPTYEAGVEGNVWTFAEPNTTARVTINDPDTITFNWQWRNQGSDWLPLCDRVAKRVAGQ